MFGSVPWAPAVNTLPKNAPSWFGNSGSWPQPTAVFCATSQSGTWMPAVFTCASRQADTFSWQFVSHAPFCHCGAMPSRPWNV